MGRVIGIALRLLAVTLVLMALPAAAEKPTVGSWIEYEVKNSGTKLADNDGAPYRAKLMVTGEEDGKFWYETVVTDKRGKRVHRFLAEPITSPSNLEEHLHPWGKIERLIVQQNSDQAQELPPSAFSQNRPYLVAALNERSATGLKLVDGPEKKDTGTESATIGETTFSLKNLTETRKEESKVDLKFIKIEHVYDVTVEAGVADDVPLTDVAKAKVKVVHTSLNARPGQEATPTENTLTSLLNLRDFGKEGAKSAIQGEPVKVEQANPFSFLPLQKKSGQ